MPSRSGEKGGSDLDNDFAKALARQEELHRGKLRKQFFQPPVVKQLQRLMGTALFHLQGGRVLNAECVEGDGFLLVVGMEEGQHVAVWTNNLVQALHHSGEQRRRKIFQNVPYE